MTSSDVAILPEFPGENFFSHAATAYREQVEARLAELGWLAAAQGLQSEAVKAIVDVDTGVKSADPTPRSYPALHTLTSDASKYPTHASCVW